MNSREDEVVIVGGGPVGLVTAMFLAERGVRSTVLEKEREVPKDLRASTFHPPTLDMLDTIGVTAGLIGQGLICPTWQFRDRREGEVATFDLGLLKNDTAHPYRLQCEQWKLSEMLRDRADDSDMIRIVFSAEAVEIDQDDNGACVTAARPDGARQTFSGRYVIGADGAGSPVRKAAGITLEGATIPELFLSMSTPFQFHQMIPDLANIAYITDPDEWVVLLRTPTLWRILVPNDPNQPAQEMLDPANMNARIQALCPRDGVYEIAHATAYRVQQRVADRYVAGRTILVGDAAHLNNPLGGMGLNGGIHDAVNLAEKLAAICAGAPAEPLLGRFERQRRKVAMDTVQEQSLRNRRMMAEKDPAQRRAYHDDLRRTVADPAAHHAYVLKSSMIASLRDAEAVA
ncbi:MAG: FAD-dependent oxidoreductase [Pseudomonadota bacterium]